MNVLVRTAEDGDRPWIAAHLRERWGSTASVSRGRVHNTLELPALIACIGDERVGLATYALDGDECELVTLDAFLERRGVGTALLLGVTEVARTARCRRLWLTTSNDNIAVLRFYQRRGLRLVAVHLDAIARARELKPEIPATSSDGIPMRDELELELALQPQG